ncbi:MAG TPA: cysteine--tRNA ligase [Acidimicrobiales bacterium]|nr:cysteine--tRNA ligase [Acidimicrobiales bacterium]
MTLRLNGRPVPVIGTARIYVCGITPYGTTHLGHASTFVWIDVLARVLRHTGVEVEVCRNITDIDDDMLEQARRQHDDWRMLAARQTYRFEDDMRQLRVGQPTFEPQAHAYVDEVITLAGALLDAGAAYQRDGAVYQRGPAVAERAGLDRETALALVADHGGGADDPSKDDPLDTPVWQRSGEGEPAWPSPWGPGRPGWHSECAAMALATLGPGIDVHGGGADLVFPHHAYEAAQAEDATGVRPFARSWLHAGTVTVGGEKMAKSTGNLVLVHDLLEDNWPPGAIRLLLIDRPWAESWDYSAEGLAAAADRLDRLWSRAGTPASDAASEQAALDALLDDLDVPRALGIAEEAGGHALRSVGGLLGLF